MPYYSRKRKSTNGYTNRPYKRPYKRPFVPGKDRVGGYYGRYKGSGGRKTGELKFHDVIQNDTVVAQTTTITPSVNLIAQGITESTRVGRKCTLKSIHWRYQISLPQKDAQATPEEGDSCRVVLYIDKQCNGATIVGLDLFETESLQSFRNLANTNRFTILCDKIHNIRYGGMASDGAGLVSQGKEVMNTSVFKTLNLPIEFSSTTGVITEIRSNNIGILLISSSGVCGFNGNLRVRFSDGS